MQREFTVSRKDFSTKGITIFQTSWRAQRCPRKKKFEKNVMKKIWKKTLTIHECPQKNFSPFGPAVWPAIGNIYYYRFISYTKVKWYNMIRQKQNYIWCLFYYIDNYHTEQNRFSEAQRKIGKKIDVKKGLVLENVEVGEIKVVWKMLRWEKLKWSGKCWSGGN